MTKPSSVRRPKFADEKYLGPEPTVTEKSSQIELGRAYSWFNYFYNGEDAIQFAMSYLQSEKEKQTMAGANAESFPRWVGWNCRLLAAGSQLPAKEIAKTDNKIKEILSSLTGQEETSNSPKVVISIQDRVTSKANDLIGELEEQLDVFFEEGVVQFDVKKWSLEKSIKPQIAKRIAEHFRPQYDEIVLALSGKDEELAESYRSWRKPVLKIMALFIKKIVDHMIELDSAGQTVRKPRAKKIKPASVLVSKVQYLPDFAELNIKSVDPKGIIGASQVWLFNTKYRALSVYNAVGNSGLSVRGTTLTGFDEAISITKKVRKPQGVVTQVINEGKVGLRSIMKNLKTNEIKATGRINKDTIILRIVK